MPTRESSINEGCGTTLTKNEEELHLIFGALGQDGSYLVDQLTSKGYAVVGVTRNSSLIPIQNSRENINYVKGNITDVSFILNLLKTYKPTHIYNLASASSVSESHIYPDISLQINYEFVRLLIECIEMSRPHLGNEVFLLQASSSEMFGPSHKNSINENSSHDPRSPYAEHKSMAHNLCQNARVETGIKIGNAILFNHESPRRPLKFVSRKVTRGAYLISQGIEEKLHLGNLQISRDWGYAPDYVKAMQLISQNMLSDDFVVATGQLHSLTEMCSIAFEAVGIFDFMNYVVSDSSLFRNVENSGLVGNSSKLKELTQWEPEISFELMIKKMILAESKESIAP